MPDHAHLKLHTQLQYVKAPMPAHRFKTSDLRIL